MENSEYDAHLNCTAADSKIGKNTTLSGPELLAESTSNLGCMIQHDEELQTLCHALLPSAESS